MDLRQSLASQGYAQARTAATPAKSPSQGIGEFAKGMVEDFVGTLAAGEQTAKAAMVGGADPHALVQALAATELAVETAVTVRDKVVEAYQELLRMPV
jgi:flagellar hook-basal body complex protein FliE